MGSFYRQHGKRALDIVGALIGLLLFSPVLAILALVVRWRLGAPILFHQLRPGLCGKAFKMIKFRTMTEIGDADGNTLSDAERLQPFGRFLRGTSLDELPELFNVLKGEMSLVGPRPLLMEYLSLYTAHQAKRHDVQPGITGWAQVNGRNAIGWEEKFELDVWYVQHLSLSLDLKILWRTILQVVRRQGISGQGSVTMEKFRGSNPQREVDG